MKLIKESSTLSRKGKRLLREHAEDVRDQVIIKINEPGYLTKREELLKKGYKVLWTGEGKICMAKPKKLKESRLVETGEWEDDEEGIAWKQELADRIRDLTGQNVSVEHIEGFDKYQGPYYFDGEFEYWMMDDAPNSLYIHDTGKTVNAPCWYRIDSIQDFRDLRKGNLEPVNESCNPKKLKESWDWEGDLPKIAYEMIDAFEKMDYISWDDFDEQFALACRKVLGIDNVWERETLVIDGKEREITGDIEPDLRTILSLNGYATIFEGDNEGGLEKVTNESLNEMADYDLRPEYDARHSFYSKARVNTDEGANKLYSYNTLVAEIKNGKPVVYNVQSLTTLRHVKEWLLQNGFNAVSKAQIVRDYGDKNIKVESCKSMKHKKSLKESRLNESDEDEKLTRAIFDTLGGVQSDDFFDLIKDIVERALYDIDETTTEDDLWDIVYQAMDDGMIYTKDQWTMLEEYNTPQEANFEDAWLSMESDVYNIIRRLKNINESIKPVNK